MCTISWKKNASSQPDQPQLSVYFNRDEQRTRPSAQAPTIHLEKGISFLAPIDPLRGGTWIGANQCGHIIALLNNYSVPASKEKSYQSRGQLVASLLIEKEQKAQGSTLDQMLSSANYPAFSLLYFSPQNEVQKFLWDEQSLKKNRYNTSVFFQQQLSAPLQNPNESILEVHFWNTFNDC